MIKKYLNYTIIFQIKLEIEISNMETNAETQLQINKRKNHNKKCKKNISNKQQTDHKNVLHIKHICRLHI